VALNRTFQVSSCPVAAEPAMRGGTYDYADSFDVRLEKADHHSPEQWVRTSLEESGQVIRGLIRIVHGRVLRFELGPTDAAHVLGWRIVTAGPDAVHIAAHGRLMHADIMARRTSPTRLTVTTFLVYERPAARVVWVAVGPLHRRIAPYLMGRAAKALSVGERAEA
jgi:hypothetical protein